MRFRLSPRKNVMVFAALPQHIAVNLWLTVAQNSLRRLCLRPIGNGGGASKEKELASPERQSLSALGCGRAAGGSTGQRRYRSVNFSDVILSFCGLPLSRQGLLRSGRAIFSSVSKRSKGKNCDRLSGT